MKYYIDEQMGCAYRISPDYKEVLEFAPMMSDGTLDDEDFNPVEPELVGEEIITFKGVDTNLYGVFKTVTEILRSK